jgi:peptide/nickel transport system ATP-binding protein
MSVLEVEGLVVSFPGESGRKAVVDHVDLCVDRGETLALVGRARPARRRSSVVLPQPLGPTTATT